ncbi:putative glycosyl hydrolase [Mycoplasmoides fastidiosum]|uniref:Glycosyl hydrolase n=1 Tax=Mycoplasmoides fastidiosum TaxID=92758 RepID=A0ABU0LYT0_9BACT|nr:glycosyl hydrolase family 65 protein [Mycoplasmoides fastidiosum]MDQ0513850.1 putative glycosyl hydrolase [Mycoplasmoides fastidiosum]UUD37735.1 glycoside hydrolase family 65 protein [Mycoplasmoides fastidiosum]
MQAKLYYDTINKIIRQKGFNRDLTAKTESIFSQGNGTLGIRGVDEEIESFNKEDFFVNGVFNVGDKEEVSELANLADTLQTKISIDQTTFSLSDSSGLISYEKWLDLHTGLLTRTIEHQIGDKKFQFIFERIVSQKHKNFYVQRITVKQLSGAASQIIVYPRINGQVTNSGIQHCNEGTKKLVGPNHVSYTYKTNQSDLAISQAMFLNVYSGDQKLFNNDNDFILQMSRRQVGFKVKTELRVDKPLHLEKVMAIATAINPDSPNGLANEEQFDSLINQQNDLIKNLTLEKVIEDNHQFYTEKIYRQFTVEIIGESEQAQYARLALMFSLYHANNFVPQNNPFLSVGAKGLSGEGYQGHCYWDTEFFIVPNYTFSNPQVARNLLEYRFKGLEGARAKAQESGLQGAQFPWEMGWPTDGELTPFWGQPDIITGEQVPIASRAQEIHVSADIAICLWQYYQATNDEQFMLDMGYQMLLETAWYYTNRAEPKNSGYEITDVMGPNEYKGNIDNNNFINFAVQENLRLALKVLPRLQQKFAEPKLIDGKQYSSWLEYLTTKIPYQINFDLIKKVADNLKIQKPNAAHVIPENDQFLHLPKLDVLPFQFLGDAGNTLFNTSEGIKRLSGQLVKQADVVLSLFAFPEYFDQNLVKTNFEYYEPITTHDSSLSAATYMIIANDLKDRAQAYKLFEYAINIDMGTNFHSCDKGIHAGSLCAIWQMIVFGFGGFRFWSNSQNDDYRININPLIPQSWNSLKYRVQVRNTWIEIDINQETFTIKLLDGTALDVYVNNQKETITIEKPRQFEVVKSWR